MDKFDRTVGNRTRTLGGRLIVFASMILEAWKFDSEPIENQLEFEAPDFWLTLERADVAERTERPDSELIEDKAEIEKLKLMILIISL